MINIKPNTKILFQGDSVTDCQRNRENEILFIDLRTWTENPVKNEGKKKVLLDDTQIQRAADIYDTIGAYFGYALAY